MRFHVYYYIKLYTMCGIVAGIQQDKSKSVVESLLFGLEQLQNRGYDSAGITTITKDKHFITHKYSSSRETNAVEILKTKRSSHKEHTCGIGHTRWATHGAKTDYNAHPHVSFDGLFSLVHNGILENFQVLKEKLLSNNISFSSQTDTEVIVNLIAYHYHIILSYHSPSENKQNKRKNIKRAIQQALEEMEGTWGIVVISTLDPDTLYCFRHGSPLLISYDKSYAFVVSEQSGFNEVVNNYISIDNHDICILSTTSNGVHIHSNKEYTSTRIQNKQHFSKENYPHWMKKEIFEQTDSSLRSISLGGRILSNNKVKLGGLQDYHIELKEVDHIILLGCGTSYYAAKIGAHYMKQFSIFHSIQVIDGASFSMLDIPKQGKTALLLLSQSGETKDLHRCIEIGKQMNTLLIGVVNVVDSLIAREVDCGCYINAGREVGVASTKSFTSQVLVLILIALFFSQLHRIHERKRIEYIKDLRKISLDIEGTLQSIQSDDSSFLKFFKDKKNCFILGKDIGEYIALEGALKIKEVSYIHAEGYSSSSLKHGPFALLDEEFPVILLDTSTFYRAKICNAYEEIKSRNAPILFITNDQQYNTLPESMKQNPFLMKTSTNSSFQELLYIIPLQYLAYMLSVDRGFNPDMPRNLAKVVTVE